MKTIAGLAVLAAAVLPQDVGEYEVKAAYLYNFAIHVEWPAEAFEDKNSPIILCILGNGTAGGTIERVLKDKTAQDREVHVKRAGTPEEIGLCHILFVPGSEDQDFEKALQVMKGPAVLVVGESEELALRGAVLNFFMERSRVRFEANVGAAERRKLKIGAKLLKIARIVDESGK